MLSFVRVAIQETEYMEYFESIDESSLMLLMKGPGILFSSCLGVIWAGIEVAVTYRILRAK